MSLISLEQALQLRQNQRLVFTNGVFDLLHVGHVSYLEAARQLGDLLLVGLNTDESVRRLNKGEDRPWNTLADRAKVVQALRWVDGVITMESDNPIELIQVLKPEVHCKGGDYDPELMIETPAVRSYGGQVVILPMVIGHSSTTIMKRLEGH